LASAPELRAGSPRLTQALPSTEAAGKIAGMAATKIDRHLAAAAIGVLAAYLALAYLLAPFFWRHFEHQPSLAGFEATTRIALGLPGDVINVGLESSEDDVLCAMHAAGWRPADPVTLSSSVRIIGSVLLDRPYLGAPVSPLFYQNRKQDLAFEKRSGESARTRHHVRFWKALDAGDDACRYGWARPCSMTASASATIQAVTPRPTSTLSATCSRPTFRSRRKP
jgi:hypothetical protein